MRLQIKEILYLVSCNKQLCRSSASGQLETIALQHGSVRYAFKAVKQGGLGEKDNRGIGLDHPSVDTTIPVVASHNGAVAIVDDAILPIFNSR